MELDIAEFRKMEAELHGFELPDFSMKFYYDETRNARKFRVSSNGVNSSDAVEYDYILGGIAFACKEEELNIDDLFKRIKLQPTAKELKYNLLVNGPRFLERTEQEFFIRIYRLVRKKSNLYPLCNAKQFVLCNCRYCR